jgi:hypothetical protein
MVFVFGLNVLMPNQKGHVCILKKPNSLSYLGRYYRISFAHSLASLRGQYV